MTDRRSLGQWWADECATREALIDAELAEMLKEAP